MLEPQNDWLQFGHGYFRDRSWNSSSCRFQSNFLLNVLSQDVHQNFASVAGAVDDDIELRAEAEENTLSRLEQLDLEDETDDRCLWGWLYDGEGLISL